VQMMMSPAGAPREPTHLVLFPAVADAWPAVEELTGATRAAAMKADIDSFVSWLPSLDVGSMDLQVFDQLGVAAMDLDGNMRERIEQRGGNVQSGCRAFGLTPPSRVRTF